MKSNTLTVKYVMKQLTDATEFRNDRFYNNSAKLHKKYVKRSDINEVIPIHGSIIEIAINRCHIDFVKFLVKQPNITNSTKKSCINYIAHNLCFHYSDIFIWIDICACILRAFNDIVNNKVILTLFGNIRRVEKRYSQFTISINKTNILHLMKELYESNKILQNNDALSAILLSKIIYSYPIIAKELIFEYNELYKMANIAYVHKNTVHMSYELEQLLYEIGYLCVNPSRKTNRLGNSSKLYKFYALNDGQAPQIGEYLNMSDSWNKKYFNYEIGTKLLTCDLFDTFVTANFKLILWLFNMTQKTQLSTSIDYMGSFACLPNDIIKYIIKFLACKTGNNRDRPVRKDNLIYYC